VSEIKERFAEVWKDVEGYEGVYQVSNYGRVRRLTFTNNIVNKYRPRLVKPTDNGNGYLLVGLSINGKRKNHYVHRLVASAFIERNKDLNHVNHIDFDKGNNHVDNLEWCTPKQNIRHSAHRMRKPKSVHNKKTNTGEKYIRKRGGKYRLEVSHKRIYKSFATLEGAVRYRNEVMSGGV